MALGEVDYGLLGLIGGLTAFLSFFNSLMANAIGRYFAFSVGQAQANPEEGVEECRKWFNVALLIHTVIPLIGLVVGYPIGIWAIEKFLTIPADRIADCIWVWRWVSLSCFLTMVSLPFNAMYQAKQYIAELTIYSFVTTTLNACFLYYMVTHTGVWLTKLAFWTCLLTIAPQIVIVLRAVKIFPECRFVAAYLWSPARVKDLSVYAFFRFFGALSIMIERQGMDVLINKYLGPAKNAAMNVAGTVSGQCNGLAGSFLGALSPAITHAYGAGDTRRVHVLCYSACKYSAVMVLVFVLPLLLEAKEVFEIWLSRPPEGCVVICVCLLLRMVLENLSCGLYMPIFADGRIKGYQVSCLVAAGFSLPIAWASLSMGGGISAVGYALLVDQLFVVLIRLYFSRKICGLSVRKWIFGIAAPLLSVAILAFMGGWLLKSHFSESFIRIVFTVIVVNGLFLPLAYFFVLNKSERQFLKSHVCGKFQRKVSK